MSQTFWQKLKAEASAENRPILVLAPMADVTDASFRRVIAKYGKPDVLWTEFVSADGLMLATPEGKAKLMKNLIFTESERPIVAQFFTSKPEMMKGAAELAVKLGFDGIDINMGCPDKSIEKQGAGAASMKKPALARKVIRAAKEGAGNIPVSVKTRLGFNKNEIETWLPELLAERPAVITVHGRTRKEMSKVAAHWDQIKRAVEIRDEVQKDLSESERTLIFGNGDVVDVADAFAKAKATGVDGVMLGRAIFGKPWLFADLQNSKNGSVENNATVDVKTKLTVLVEHTKLFEELLGGTKSFALMKKHYKAYVTGWDGAKELRMELMEAENANKVGEIVSKYLLDTSI
ncbi:MAG: tRNA-dihydrouridine synthase [bacterium]